MMCRESVRETLDNWKVQGDVIDRYAGEGAKLLINLTLAENSYMYNVL
jgi:hypothetical protein